MDLMRMEKPSYLELYVSGELDNRVAKLYQILKSCELCPRRCGADRLNGKAGFCRSRGEMLVSNFFPHFGEEGPLVGAKGSGTIFLANCNLDCVYCQNYDISHLGFGSPKNEDQVAEIMLGLQDRGCHNINLVTPTHFAPQLVKALKLAVERGLALPLVWNCGGYESLDVLRLLQGIVDIYMPDIKYGDDSIGKKYSGIPDYFTVAKKAVKEMQRQVGELKIDARGIAFRGLLIRHLVLPNDLAGTENVLKFIAEEVSIDSYVNVMPQYRPAGMACHYRELDRYPSEEELRKAVAAAFRVGLVRGL
jgi:putative pyruvate formate lyase activating enzyme